MKSKQEQKELWKLFEKMNIIQLSPTIGFKLTIQLKEKLIHYLHQKSPLNSIIFAVRDVSGPNTTEAEWDRASNFLCRFLADYMPATFGKLSNYRSEELNGNNQ